MAKKAAAKTARRAAPVRRAKAAKKRARARLREQAVIHQDVYFPEANGSQS